MQPTQRSSKPRRVLTIMLSGKSVSKMKAQYGYVMALMNYKLLFNVNQKLLVAIRHSSTIRIGELNFY